MIAPELFKITPRIVAAGRTAEIAVSGNFPHNDLRNFRGELRLEAVCGDGLFSNGDLPGYTCGNGYDLGRPNWEPVPFDPVDGAGVLRFRYFFRCEGESSFQLRLGERIIAEFSVYALRDEWAKLRPYRGDMHLHSGYSMCCREPGRLTPEYYAAVNCSLGMDFICISDHKQYFPSVKAADFVAQCGGDFRLYPCEEVHLPDLHNIHQLNFGGDRAISRQLHRGIPEYDRDLRKYLEIVPDWSDEYCRYMAANYHIILDRIHEAGGLAICCHPFWRPSRRLFMPGPVREYVMEHQLFDALELFGEGDLNCDETAALYLEYCMKTGRRIPAVGNNDAHMSSRAALNSTVIFARNCDLPELKKSLLSNLNVAVNGQGGGFRQTSGIRELVSFYHFLRRDYYPRHDALCARNADEMFKTLATGAPDPKYETYTHLSYPEHSDDTPDAWDRNRFTPDTAAMAAIRREKDALDREFWG